MNDIVKNKYIRATSDEHGKRIIDFLVENGARNIACKGRAGVYFIYENMTIEYFPNSAPKGYTEMFLPEDEPKDELKRGDLVEVTNKLSAWNHGVRILAGIVDGAERPFVCVIDGHENLFHSGRAFGTSSWKHCRNVETITREDAEKLIGKRIVD